MNGGTPFVFYVS